MRFKTIFWLFNTIVLLALILIAFVPLLLLGKDYAAVYWGNMWIIAALFFVLIAALDIYFIRNWQLFNLLEKEDWPTLLAWLEERLYVKGSLNRAYAGLLINTSLSVSNLEAVRKLETEIRRKKPVLLKTLGVALGIPVLLDQDPDAVLAYFSPLADDPKTRRRAWARWCRALASGVDGRDELLELLGGRDPAVRLLSVHLLDQYELMLSEEQKESVHTEKISLRSVLAGDAGERALSRSREDHLMAVVLTTRINDARKSLIEGA